jgi:integrase
MYSQMLASGLSASSVLRTHRILSRALKVAMQRGKITRKRLHTRGPADAEEARKQPADRRRGATSPARRTSRPELGSLDVCPGSRAATVRGARPEMVRCRPGSRDAVGSAVAASRRRSGAGVRGAQVGSQPPNARSPGPARRGLRLQRQVQDGERETAGSEWQGEDFVFAQANGRPLDRRSDWEHWRALLASAGVQRSVCMTAPHGGDPAPTVGVHPRVVMELLGHSEMRTTTDVYSQVMPALAREAADRMGTALWGPDRN